MSYREVLAHVTGRRGPLVGALGALLSAAWLCPELTVDDGRSVREATASIEVAADLLDHGQLRWLHEMRGELRVEASPTADVLVPPRDGLQQPFGVTEGGETQCPLAVTQCPPQETTCPAVATQCPHVATTCPRIFTYCPVLETRCKYTYCPAGPPTHCPVVTTTCPTAPTGCGGTPTQCEVTTCSEIYTVCPMEPTRCEWTKCPATTTLCPANFTTCPTIPTACPSTEYTKCSWTSCSSSPTECPTAFTTCPTVHTYCPAAETQCPQVPTVCPLTGNCANQTIGMGSPNPARDHRGGVARPRGVVTAAVLPLPVTFLPVASE